MAWFCALSVRDESASRDKKDKCTSGGKKMKCFVKLPDSILVEVTGAVTHMQHATYKHIIKNTYRISITNNNEKPRFE
jgi:hypothetical protein